MAHCPTCTCKPQSNARARKPRDPSRWPPGMAQEAIEQAIDRVCGCAGKYDCDCVSVFNRAKGEEWYRHNA